MRSLRLSTTTSQSSRRQISVLTAVLSSSVVLATVTALFYFVGGCMVRGYWQALGLNYVAGRQPAEYMFAGFESLLLLFPLSLIAAPAIGILVTLSMGRKSLTRGREFAVFLLLLGILALLCSWTLFKIRTGLTNAVITNVSCPVTGHGFMGAAGWVLLFAAAVIGIGVFLLVERILRLVFLVWGFPIWVFCLYNYGLAGGAAQLYGNFQLAEITSASLQLPFSNSTVLILGADDKNLVVLIRGEDRGGHPTPRYVLRSDVKTFRLLGSSSLNDFFCRATKLSFPKR